MRVQSIRASIEPRYPAGNRFLLTAAEMAFGKMNSVAKFHYVAKEIRTMAETLQNAWHLLPAGLQAPLVVDGGHIARGIGIFDQLDFGIAVGHGWLVSQHPEYTMNSTRLGSTFGRKLGRFRGLHLTGPAADSPASQ